MLQQSIRKSNAQYIVSETYKKNQINGYIPIQRIQKLLCILRLKFNDELELWIVWQARRGKWQHENDGKAPSGEGNHTSMLQLLEMKINKRNRYHTFRFI